MKKAASYLFPFSVFYLFFLSVYLITSGNSSSKQIIHPNNYTQAHVYGFKFPDSVLFLNENVPLSNEKVRNKLLQEINYLLNNPEYTGYYATQAKNNFQQIEQVLKNENVPADFKYLCMVESNCTNVISEKGTAGYWQFTAATARNFGLKVNNIQDDRLNVKLATKAAATYFKLAYQEFKNWQLAAASFNMGISSLQQNVLRQNKYSYFLLRLNPITERYLYKALAIKLLLEPKNISFSTIL